MSVNYQQFYLSEKEFPSHGFTWQIDNNRRSLRISSPLQVGGVIQEGFSFHGRTLLETPHRNVTFLLTYNRVSVSKGVVIAKAEWKPISSHNNKGLGPKEYRFIEQTGSHFHDFHTNFALGGKWRSKKLPIALPIEPDPPNFQGFLEFVGERFRIPNIWLVQEPPWSHERQYDLI